MILSFKTFVKQVLAFCAVKRGRVGIGQTSGHLTILMYHRVNPEHDVLGLSITPEFFDQQLAFLSSHLKVISLANAVDMINSGIPMGGHAVITFDDGYRDNYDHAFPLLKKYGIQATIFVTVDALNKGTFGWQTFDKALLDAQQDYIELKKFGLGVIKIGTYAQKKQAVVYLHRELKRFDNAVRELVMSHVVETLSIKESFERVMLSWDEAREMQSTGLVTIGSHTLTHPILTRVDKDDAYREIVESKAIIEKMIGNAVDFFAYPNGSRADFDDEIAAMLPRAGYSAACTTLPGHVSVGKDLFRLPRVDVTFGMCQGIGGRFSQEMFEAAISI